MPLAAKKLKRYGDTDFGGTQKLFDPKIVDYCYFVPGSNFFTCNRSFLTVSE